MEKQDIFLKELEMASNRNIRSAFGSYGDKYFIITEETFNNDSVNETYNIFDTIEEASKAFDLQKKELNLTPQKNKGFISDITHTKSLSSAELIKYHFQKKNINIWNKENPNLEKYELLAGAEILKNLNFNKENYKDILEVINKIKEIGNDNNNHITNEEIDKYLELNENKKAKEKVQKEQHTPIDVSHESNNLTRKKTQPIIFGKNIIPSFAILNNKEIKVYENYTIKKFDDLTKMFICNNGESSIEISQKALENILNPEVNKTEKKIELEKISSNEPTITIKNQNQQGTIIPEYTVITQKGIETFKNLEVLSFDKTSNNFILGNKNTSITISNANLIEVLSKEIKPEMKTYEKLLKNQYNDYFKQRENTAYNFRHNLAVYCRKEAKTPLDSLKIAKEIVNRMSVQEQKKCQNMLKNIAGKNETINNTIVKMYYSAINEIPRYEKSIKENYPQELIARPFYDTVSTDGALVDKNFNMHIGEVIANIAIKDNNNILGKKDVLYMDLKVLSASKEGNVVTLIDKRNNSLLEIPRDTLLQGYAKQQKQTLQKQRSYSVEIER